MISPLPLDVIIQRQTQADDNIRLRANKYREDKMLMLDLRVNNCDLALGHRVDFERLKAAGFRKAGILGKIIAVVKKKDLVYRTGNCHIACFDETFNMCDLVALPSTQCHTVAELYLRDTLLHKVVFTLRSRKIPRFNLPTSVEIYLNEFLEACHENIGPPGAIVEDWGHIWEDADSTLKAGILADRKQFFVIWELKC